MASLDLTEKIVSNSEERERAILVTVIRPNVPVWKAEDHLDELRALADTAGADEIYRVKQPRMKPDPGTFIGGGKVDEIAEMVEKKDIGLVIFDDDLTPVQVRNLEDRLQVKVVDRSGLILDIFASRARTREAKVQVELAQLEYYYPRLTKMWSHLRGQQGGIGFRGPGETQLEVDRRAVQRRIAGLKKDLEKIVRQRDTRRRGRRDAPTAALIGYTNVGKSTLLNALSGSEDAFVENRLFATLDSKVRRVAITPTRPMLIIDTVGFIRKLPHHLVASFRSTLEEAREADVLIHVADVSHPHVEEQMIQTDQVIKDMELEGKPYILVFNKMDEVAQPATLTRMMEKYPDALFMAAKKGLRIWELSERLERMLYIGNAEKEIALRPDQMALLDPMEPGVTIQNKRWDEGVIRMTLAGTEHGVKNMLRRFGMTL